MLIFLLKKNVVAFAFHSHFFSKNTCELDIALTRIVNILTLMSLLSLQCFEQVGLAIFRHINKGKMDLVQLIG